MRALLDPLHGGCVALLTACNHPTCSPCPVCPLASHPVSTTYTEDSLETWLMEKAGGGNHWFSLGARRIVNSQYLPGYTQFNYELSLQL